ncbi:GntR family transcriptional regulator [Paenibacillus thalictri]|uniref:GntR family transcriptional regulator n=1 Tax=Paenibacillus thalictri TaxID=2527873 RepID=A0A4Q9DLE0_9BACL|nr:GntR family transcriptional regulator [Paenibacillus thalictri]TBL75995.1 GntR family transcriptional regulator [Paenibacillus thalictri]
MEQLSILPAREQVAAALRKAIFSGELQVGQELTQEEVAQQLGISRMPVREAFQILERDGLLLLRKRRAIVQGLTVDDLVDHYDIRSLLEGEAAARAAVRKKDMQDIAGAQAQVEKAAAAKNTADYLSANEAFHRAIWEASESARLEGLLSQLWTGLPPHLPELLPEQIEKSITEHRQIAAAIESGGAEQARAAMSVHVKRSLDDLLKQQKALSAGSPQQ